MDDMVKHIYDYIQLLQDRFSLHISLHNRRPYIKEENTGICPGILQAFGLHNHVYCITLRQKRGLAKECFVHQGKVMPKLCRDGAFFGMCHAGVCEFVYPVCYCDGIIGFVCVSGYRPKEIDPEYGKVIKRLTNLAAVHNMDYSDLTEMHKKYLETELPDKAFLDTLILPLCDMLTLMVIKRNLTNQKYQPQTEKDMAPSTGDQLYQHICQYIRENHNEKIDLDSICAEFNYSRSYISHLFKKHSGLTLNRYINTLRIAEAKALLRYTERTVTDIAMSVGFSDSNYFTNVFREMTGVSPRKYRSDFPITARKPKIQ